MRGGKVLWKIYVCGALIETGMESNDEMTNILNFLMKRRIDVLW